MMQIEDPVDPETIERARRAVIPGFLKMIPEGYKWRPGSGSVFVRLYPDLPDTVYLTAENGKVFSFPAPLAPELAQKAS